MRFIINASGLNYTIEVPEELTEVRSHALTFSGINGDMWIAGGVDERTNSKLYWSVSRFNFEGRTWSPTNQEVVDRYPEPEYGPGSEPSYVKKLREKYKIVKEPSPSSVHETTSEDNGSGEGGYDYSGSGSGLDYVEATTTTKTTTTELPILAPDEFQPMRLPRPMFHGCIVQVNDQEYFVAG